MSVTTLLAAFGIPTLIACAGLTWYAAGRSQDSDLLALLTEDAARQAQRARHQREEPQCPGNP